MRKPVVIANWKMNLLHDEVAEYVEQLIKNIKDIHNVNVGIASQDIFLADLTRQTKGTNVHVVAQNAHWKNAGSYTGETSPQALADLGVEYVMLGHFERRELFNETNHTVNKKVRKALANGLRVIVDVEEFEQVEPVLQYVDGQQMEKITLAFEPTFAIGTGKAASEHGAQDVAKQIRENFRKLYGDDIAQNTPILYGGSVNIDNQINFMSQPDIDGVLIGKAALNVDDFTQMIVNASKLDN